MRWRESKPLTRAQVYLSLAVASMAISVGLLGVLSQELLMRSAYSLGRMSNKDWKAIGGLRVRW